MGFSERHPQLSLHLRIRGIDRGGPVLASSRGHERAPENHFHEQYHLQPFQHSDEQKDRSAWLCLQEGHRRCAGDTSSARHKDAYGRWGECACVRSQGEKAGCLARVQVSQHGVDESKLVFAQSPAEAVDGAHAIVVLTEWDEFKTYPYQDFYAKMLKPAFLFDGRGILTHKALEDIGFEVHAIGKGRGADGRLRVLGQAPAPLEC